MSTKYSRWRTVTKLAIFVAVIVQVTRAKSTYCDFKSIFHTPDSKYDEYEILERSNFCSEDPKDSKTSDQTRPQAVANAQVMLHFNGRKSEPQHGPPVHIYTPYPPQVYPMMHKHRPHHVPYYQPYGMEYYPMPRPYRRHKKRPARPAPYSVYYPSSSEEDAYFDYEEPKRKGNHVTLSDQYHPHSCGDGEESSEERSQETAEDLEDVMKLIKRLERKLAMKKKVDDGMCPAPTRKPKKPTTPKPCKPPATTTVKEETQTTEETMPYVGCEETIATSPQTIDTTTEVPPACEEKHTTPVPPCESATTTVPPNCVTEDLEALLISALVHEEKEQSKAATCPPFTTPPDEETSATPEVILSETTVPTTCGPTTIITTEEIPEACTTTAVPTYEPETTPPVPPSTTGQTDLPSSSPCVTTVPTYEPETTPTVPPSTTEESSPSTPCETTGPTFEPTTPTGPPSSTPVETTVPTLETETTPSVSSTTTEETITPSTSGVTTVPPSTTEVTSHTLTPTTCETVTTPSVSPTTTEETGLPSTTPDMTTVPPSTTEVTSPPPTDTTVTTYETVTTPAVPPSTTEETGPPSSTPDATTVPTSTTEGTSPPSTPALTTVTTPSSPPPTTEESSSPSTVPPYETEATTQKTSVPSSTTAETTISTYESTTSQIPLSTTRVTTAETTVPTEITSSIPLSTTEEISTMVSTYEPETTPTTMEETSLPSSTPCETTGPTYEPVRTPPDGSSPSMPVQTTVSTYDTETVPSTIEETNSPSTPVETTTTPVPTPTSEETSSPASTPGETTVTTYETEATTLVTPSTTEGTSLPSSTPAQTTVTTYETETTPSVPPSTTEETSVSSTGPTYDPKTTPSDLPTTSPTNTPITTPTYPPTPDDTTYSTSVRSNIDEDQDYVPPDGSWYDYYEIHGSIDKETTAGYGDSVTTERTSESKPYEDFEVPEEVYPIPMTTENDLLYRKTHEYDMKTVEVTEGYGDSVITEGLPGYGKNAKDDSFAEESESPVEEKARPGPGEFNSNFQWSTPMQPEESEVVRNKKGSSVGYEDSLTEESATTAGGYEPTEESYTYNFEENEEPHRSFHKTTPYDSFKGYPDEETVMYPTTKTSGKVKKGYNKSGEESEEIGYITTDELMHPEARKAKKKPTKEWFHTYSKEKETFVPIEDTQHTTDEKNEEPGYITTEELMHSKDGGITEYTENVPFFHGGHSARKKPKGGTITATEATPHVIKKKPSAIYDEDASVEDTIEDSLMSASTHSMTYLKKPDGYHEERSERSVSTTCDEEVKVKIEESTEGHKPVIEENGGPPIYVFNSKGIHSTGELKKPHGLKVLDKASKGGKPTHSDSETSQNENQKAKRKESPEFKESGDMVPSKEVMKSSSIEDSSKESGKIFNSGEVNWSSSRKSPAEFDETSKELKKPKSKPTKSKDSSKGSGKIFETEKLKKPERKPTAIDQSSEAVPIDVHDSGVTIKGDTASYKLKKPKSDDSGATKEAFGGKEPKVQTPKVQIGKDATKKHSSIQKSSKSQDDFEESDDSPDSAFLNSEEEFEIPRKEDAKKPKNQGSKVKTKDKKGSIKSQDEIEESGDSSVYVPTDDLFYSEEDLVYPTREDIKKLKDQSSENQSTPNKRAGKIKDANNSPLKDFVIPEDLPRYGKNAKDDGYAEETETSKKEKKKGRKLSSNEKSQKDIEENDDSSIYVPRDVFLQSDEELIHPKNKDSKTLKDRSLKVQTDQSTPNKRTGHKEKANNWSSNDSLDDSYAEETESPIVPGYKPTVHVSKDDFLHWDEEPAHPRRQDSKTSKDRSPKDQSTPNKGRGKKKKAKNRSSEDSATTEGFPGYGKHALDDSYAGETESPIVPEYKPTVHLPTDEFLHLDEEPAHPRRQDSKTPKDLSLKDKSTPNKGAGKKKKAKNRSSEDFATTEGLPGYGKKALDDSYAGEIENPVVADYKSTVYVPKDEFLHLDEEPAHPRRQDSKTPKYLSPEDQSTPNKRAGNKKKAKNRSSEDSATTEGLPGYGKNALDDSYTEESPMVADDKSKNLKEKVQRRHSNKKSLDEGKELNVPMDKFLHSDEELTHPESLESKIPKDQMSKVKIEESSEETTYVVTSEDPDMLVPDGWYSNLGTKPSYVPKEKKKPKKPNSNSPSQKTYPEEENKQHYSRSEDTTEASNEGTTYVVISEDPATKTEIEESTTTYSTEEKKQPWSSDEIDQVYVTSAETTYIQKKPKHLSPGKKREKPSNSNSRYESEFPVYTSTHSDEEFRRPNVEDLIEESSKESSINTDTVVKKDMSRNPEGGIVEKKKTKRDKFDASSVPIFAPANTEKENESPNIDDIGNEEIRKGPDSDENFETPDIGIEYTFEESSNGPTSKIENPKHASKKKKRRKTEDEFASIYISSSSEEQLKKALIGDWNLEDTVEKTVDVNKWGPVNSSGQKKKSNNRTPKEESDKVLVPGKKVKKLEVEESSEGTIYVLTSEDTPINMDVKKPKIKIEDGTSSQDSGKRKTAKTWNSSRDLGKEIKKPEYFEAEDTVEESTTYVVTSEAKEVKKPKFKDSKADEESTKHAKKPKGWAPKVKVEDGSKESVTYLVTSEVSPVKKPKSGSLKVKVEDGTPNYEKIKHSSGKMKKPKLEDSEESPIYVVSSEVTPMNKHVRRLNGWSPEMKKPKFEDPKESTVYVVTSEVAPVNKHGRRPKGWSPKVNDKDDSEESVTYVVTSEVAPIKKPVGEAPKRKIVEAPLSNKDESAKGSKSQDDPEESSVYVLTEEMKKHSKASTYAPSDEDSYTLKKPKGKNPIVKIKESAQKYSQDKFEGNRKNPNYAVNEEMEKPTPNEDTKEKSKYPASTGESGDTFVYIKTEEEKKPTIEVAEIKSKGTKETGTIEDTKEKPNKGVKKKKKIYVVYSSHNGNGSGDIYEVKKGDEEERGKTDDPSTVSAKKLDFEEGSDKYTEVDRVVVSVPEESRTMDENSMKKPATADHNLKQKGENNKNQKSDKLKISPDEEDSDKYTEVDRFVVSVPGVEDSKTIEKNSMKKPQSDKLKIGPYESKIVASEDSYKEPPRHNPKKKPATGGPVHHDLQQKSEEYKNPESYNLKIGPEEGYNARSEESLEDTTSEDEDVIDASVLSGKSIEDYLKKKIFGEEKESGKKKVLGKDVIADEEKGKIEGVDKECCLTEKDLDKEIVAREESYEEPTRHDLQNMEDTGYKESEAPICTKRDQAQVDGEGVKVFEGTGKKKGPKITDSHDVYSEKDAIEEIFNDGDGEKKKEGVGFNEKKEKGAGGSEDKVDLYGNKSEELEKSGENEKGTEESKDGTGSSDIYTEKEAIKENYGGKGIDEDVFHVNKDREFKESDDSHNYGKKKKGIGVSEDKVEPHGGGNFPEQKKKPGIEDDTVSENKGREFEESDSGEDFYEKKKKGIGVSEDEGKSSENNKKQNRKLSGKATKGPKGRGEQRKEVIEDQVFLYVTTEKTSPSYVKVKPTTECDDSIPLALVEHGSLPGKQGHDAESEESLEDTTGEDEEVLIDASALSGKSIGDYLKKKIFDEEKEPGKKKGLGEGKPKTEDKDKTCYLTKKDSSEEIRKPLEETYVFGDASEERAAASCIVEDEDNKYREEIPVIEGGVQLKSEEINGFKEDKERDESTCTVTEETNVSSSYQGYGKKSSRGDEVDGGDVKVKIEGITGFEDKGLGDEETHEFTCTTTEEAGVSSSHPGYKEKKEIEIHFNDELELGEAEDQIEDKILKKDLNHVVVNDKVEYRPTTLSCDDADATATPVYEFKELKEYEVPVITKEPDPCECLTEVTTIHAGSDDDKPKELEVVPNQKSNADALKTLYRALKHIKEAAEQHLSKVKIDPKKLGEEVVKKGEFVSPYDLYNSADEKSSKVGYEGESTLSGKEERVDGSEEGYQPIEKEGLDGEETDNGGEEIRVQVMEAVRPYNIEKQKKKGRGQETEKSNEERGFVTECLTTGPSNGQYKGYRPLKKKNFGERQEVGRSFKEPQGKKVVNPNEERGFATECSAPNNDDYVSYRPMKKKGFEERLDQSEGNYQPTEKKEGDEMKTEVYWPNKKKVAEERDGGMGGEERGPQEKYYPVTPGNARSIGYRPIKKKRTEEKSGEETLQRKYWVAEKGPEGSDEEKPKQKPSENIEYWPEKKKGVEESGEERKPQGMYIPVKPSNVDDQKSKQPKRTRGEERVYLSDERVYPSGVRVYPNEERVYPSGERVYPSEERKHPIETTGSSEFVEYWPEKKKVVEERVVSSEETGFLEKPPRKYLPVTPDNVGDIVYWPHKSNGPSSNVENPANWPKKKKGNEESQRKDPLDHIQDSEYRPAKKKGPSNVENQENWSKKETEGDEEPQRKNPVSQDLPAKKKGPESTKRPFTDYEVVKTVPTYQELNPKPYKVYRTYEDGPYYKEDLTEESPEESIETPTTPKPLYKLVYKPVSKKRPSQSKYQRVMPHIYAKTTPAPPSEELIPGSSEEEEAKDLPAKLIRKVGKILAGHGNGFDVFLSDKMLKRPVQRRPKVYLYKGSKGSEPCTDRYQVYPPPYFLPYPPPIPQYAPVDPYGMVHPNGRRCPYCAPYRRELSSF